MLVCFSDIHLGHAGGHARRGRQREALQRRLGAQRLEAEVHARVRHGDLLQTRAHGRELAGGVGRGQAALHGQGGEEALRRHERAGPARARRRAAVGRGVALEDLPPRGGLAAPQLGLV